MTILFPSAHILMTGEHIPPFDKFAETSCSFTMWTHTVSSVTVVSSITSFLIVSSGPQEVLDLLFLPTKLDAYLSKKGMWHKRKRRYIAHSQLAFRFPLSLLKLSLLFLSLQLLKFGRCPFCSEL